MSRIHRAGLTTAVAAVALAAGAGVAAAGPAHPAPAGRGAPPPRARGGAGVAGEGPDTFNGPSDVLVAPGGDIFVVDGHGAGGNNRVVKVARDGRVIQAW